jgi:hypothetical protein
MVLTSWSWKHIPRSLLKLVLTLVSYPTARRILDQLGCYETFLKLAETPVENLFIRNPEGEVMASFEKVSSQSIERSVPVTSVSLLVNILHYDRHGYPIRFLDRQMVMLLLYAIQDKSKMLNSNRVTVV